MAAIQLAKQAGATVISTASSDEKLERLKPLGLDHGINYARESFVDRVRELTDGRGVDIAFEALGRPETFMLALEIVGDGGRMVAVGIAPGKTTAPVEITRLVRRGLRIIGSYGARTRADMPEIIRLAARGTFRPERAVTRRFALDEADDAYQALDRGEILGRAIVMMEETA
jgi:S-(hydroxymethyl)glutathione dehydrogenase/alcohol dehydrogenase